MCLHVTREAFDNDQLICPPFDSGMERENVWIFKNRFYSKRNFASFF